MRYLIDTHVLLWAIRGIDKLSDKAEKILENPENDIIVSSVNFWEISIKHRTGKLDISPKTPDELPIACNLLGFKFINLSVEAAANFYQLPEKENHRDPFDRMLIWQAIQLNIPIISKDDKFEQYASEGLKLIW
jgi:PIN domain nuclease of toxin-antitoxin system